MADRTRQAYDFIPISTDPGKIRFFGTLMPALLLIKASPARFIGFQFAARITPRVGLGALVDTQADDAGRIGDTLIFVHRWNSEDFDPFCFARAKTFLARAVRIIHREGYSAEPIPPLAPHINLPKLAASAGLGNLSPFGLLVHAAFGPRLILSGLRTDHPFTPRPRWGDAGCNDCLSCVRICPQEPEKHNVIELRLCQTCTRCLGVCPAGK